MVFDRSLLDFLQVPAIVEVFGHPFQWRGLCVLRLRVLVALLRCPSCCGRLLALACSRLVAASVALGIVALPVVCESVSTLLVLLVSAVAYR